MTILFGLRSPEPRASRPLLKALAPANSTPQRGWCFSKPWDSPNPFGRMLGASAAISAGFCKPCNAQVIIRRCSLPMAF